MTTDRRADIVLIDDHPEHLDYLATLLRRAGYGVAAFNHAALALCYLKRYPPRLVITDVFMPEKDGFEVLREVKRELPGLPLIAVSGAELGEQALYLESMRHLGAHAAFAKPVDDDALLATVAALIGPPEPAAAP
jgi:two-component system response regulator GlrR